MDIKKERTRLLITNYTDGEKRHLEDMVASLDNVYMYYDPDYNVIGLEPGIENTIRRVFPYAKFKDNSLDYWEYNRITPVEHNAAPRNQLQRDFIDFVLTNAKKKQKLAGILGVGTGKAIPNSILIPVPRLGLVPMSSIEVGDAVLGIDGRAQFVTGVFPQGVLDVYEITFDDDRTAKCSSDHLWFVCDNEYPNGHVIATQDMIDNFEMNKYSIPTLNGKSATFYNWNNYDETLVDKIKKHEIELIPESLIYDSPDNRERFIYELSNDTHSIENFSQYSKTIQDQIIFIIRSLGFTCYFGDDNDLSFFITNQISIKSIKLVGQEECTCIKVQNEDGLFLTENFVITHNTFMACYSAIAIGLKTMFIVPTSSIKQQWVDTLTGMFQVPSERVCNVAGPNDFINKAPNCDFVVVSHASLASLNKKYNLEKLIRRNKFGIKVIDEVQMWFKNIILIDANSNIANNWYLTGTFGRSSDTENRIYQEMFGDLAIFREKEKDPTIFNRKPGNVYGMKPYQHVTMVWTKSGLSKEEMAAIKDSIRYSEREGRWIRFGYSVADYMKMVFPDDGTVTQYMQKILLVLKIAEKKVPYGKTLMLGSTINSAELMAIQVRKLFPNKKVGTYHSRNTKEENDRNKKECDILVSTTSSAGTGFDWKGLGKLILYTPLKSWILTSQILGRLRRRDDGKDTYMWDIVDSQFKQFRAWANSRADVYRRVAKTFKVVDL